MLARQHHVMPGARPAGLFREEEVAAACPAYLGNPAARVPVGKNTLYLTFAYGGYIEVSPC